MAERIHWLASAGHAAAGFGIVVLAAIGLPWWAALWNGAFWFLRELTRDFKQVRPDLSVMTTSKWIEATAGALGGWPGCISGRAVVSGDLPILAPEARRRAVRTNYWLIVLCLVTAIINVGMVGAALWMDMCPCL